MTATGQVSKFTGTWQDENKNQATITGSNGKVSVHYINVPSRPGTFHGKEFDFALAPANIVVQFTDVDPDFQMVQGVLQDAGKRIDWSNLTTWTKVSDNT